MNRKHLLWLIFFFPVGLGMICMSDNYTKRFKIIITNVFLWGIILFGISQSKFVDVNPCDCSELSYKTQVIGYDNLSSESKELFSLCESKYKTLDEASAACVDRVSKKVNSK